MKLALTSGGSIGALLAMAGAIALIALIALVVWAEYSPRPMAFVVRKFFD